MKRLSFLAVAAITFTIALGMADGSENSKIYVEHLFVEQLPVVGELAPEELLIMPWGWSPGDEKALKEIKECGFNLAGFITPEYAKIAEKVGLKYIIDDIRISEAVTQRRDISDDEIAELVEESTAPFRGNKMVFGYYLRDEPLSGEFANLARWRKALAKAETNATAYINLLPNCGQNPNGYDEYIEKFVSTVQPSYLSYDMYSLRDDGTMNQLFYTHLEVMRTVAMRHDLPFWNIILANSHFHYSIASAGGLNVQVYSTLAYGGRGICYFTYFSPTGGDFRDAAVDQFLNKTPTWDRVRFLNMQVRQLAPTYLKLKSVNVFHNSDVPQGCKGLNTSKFVAEVNGGNFLVGEFEDPDGVPYVMIVNKDIQKSTTFAVKFKEAGRVMMTSPYTGLTVPFGGLNNWLAPGQGILLSLVK